MQHNPGQSCWRFDFSFKANVVLFSALFPRAASTWPGNLVCLPAPFIFFYNFSFAFWTKSHNFLLKRVNILPLSLKTRTRKPSRTQKRADWFSTLTKTCAHRPTSCQCGRRYVVGNHTLHASQFTYVFCQSEDNSRRCWSFVSFQQGLVGGSYGDK